MKALLTSLTSASQAAIEGPTDVTDFCFTGGHRRPCEKGGSWCSNFKTCVKHRCVCKFYCLDRRGFRGWVLGRRPPLGWSFAIRNALFNNIQAPVQHWAPTPGRNPVSTTVGSAFLPSILSANQGRTQGGGRGASLGVFGSLRVEGPRGPNSCEDIRNPHRRHEICAENHKKHVRAVERPLAIWVYLENGPTRKTGPL